MIAYYNRNIGDHGTRYFYLGIFIILLIQYYYYIIKKSWDWAAQYKNTYTSKSIECAYAV